jgi:hypothetical protein
VLNHGPGAALKKLISEAHATPDFACPDLDSAERAVNIYLRLDEALAARDAVALRTALRSAMEGESESCFLPLFQLLFLCLCRHCAARFRFRFGFVSRSVSLSPPFRVGPASHAAACLFLLRCLGFACAEQEGEALPDEST